MGILYFKVFHLLFVISWMAGIFYLPRILVHYSEGIKNQEDCHRLLIMARKLFFFSLTLFVFVLLTGAILWLYFQISGKWLHLKLVFVFLLFIYQLHSYRLVLLIKKGNTPKPALFYRIYNEASIIILFIILFLVIVKPI